MLLLMTLFWVEYMEFKAIGYIRTNCFDFRFKKFILKILLFIKIYKVPEGYCYLK